MFHHFERELGIMDTDTCDSTSSTKVKERDREEPNRLLMKYLGHSWPMHYETDFFEFLCLHESKRKDNYMMSPQKDYRADIVSWMKEVCKYCNLSILTLHLAAYILDSFMDGFKIPPFRLRFIAASSISLAAKFEENAGCIPSYGKMYSVNNPSYQPVPPPKIIQQIEWKIFRYMNCNLHVPTAAHFTYYFLVKGLQKTDFIQRSDLSELELRMEYRDILQKFLDDMLDDLWTLKIKPSWMASASLIYTRRLLGLHPEWPIEIAQMTNLTIKMLSPAMKLMNNYCSNSLTSNNEENAANESGYASMSSLADCNAPSLLISPPANYDVSMSQASQEKSPDCYVREAAGPISCSFTTSTPFLPAADLGQIDIFSQETIKMESP